MSTEKTIIEDDWGVELWRTELTGDVGVLGTAYFIKSLRTPESPGFNDLAAAREAFQREVALSAASNFVKKRLGIE